jgi:hypothetical protein
MEERRGEKIGVNKLQLGNSSRSSRKGSREKDEGPKGSQEGTTAIGPTQAYRSTRHQPASSSGVLASFVDRFCR